MRGSWSSRSAFQSLSGKAGPGDVAGIGFLIFGVLNDGLNQLQLDIFVRLWLRAVSVLVALVVNVCAPGHVAPPGRAPDSGQLLRSSVAFITASSPVSVSEDTAFKLLVSPQPRQEPYRSLVRQAVTVGMVGTTFHDVSPPNVVHNHINTRREPNARA